MFPSEDNISAVFLSGSCPNCSSASSEIDPTKAVVLGLVLGVFVLFGVMGNILVILSVACHRHLRSVAHYFIANLAVADLLLSSAVLPFSAASELLGRWVFGRWLCSAWAALDVLCCTASILSLCVISVDRYVAVSYPLRYPSLATGRRGLAAVAVLWGLSAAISVGPLFGWREPMPEDEAVCRVNEDPGYALFSAVGSFYLPLGVILAMYCRVYVVARSKTRGLSEGRNPGGGGSEGVALRIHRGHAPRSLEEEEERREAGKHREDRTRRGRCSDFSPMRLLKFSREKKAAKTLGIVVGCFVLCWLPFFLVLPISSILPSHRPSDTVFKITFWLGYFNSCLNPIIYPCFSQEFKKAFQNVLHGRCLRRASRHMTPRSPGAGSLSLANPQSPQFSFALSRNSATLSVSPSSPGCWRTFTDSDGATKPGHTQAAKNHSKSLLKACCFTTSRDTPAHPDTPVNPSPAIRPPQTRVLRASLEDTGGEPV
ncbi:alpha-1A adrenergic receptor [Chanos chanos]|uniref:Alpha-1A adrenergic receptor n=1 Tax=Chanos chanos TaxID=29144 RepID=A0A6J2UX73_CHACN|nr:alpha-1A adrenergic receptor-like [Chanos chanos]